MKREAAKIVKKLLNFEQKQRCMDIAQEMLSTFNDDPDLLKKVITGDESRHWNQSPIISMEMARRAMNEKITSSSVKCNGVVHHEFLLQVRTLNKKYYHEVMRRLRQAIC